jgi:hypothetical protein
MLHPELRPKLVQAFRDEGYRLPVLDYAEATK